MKRKAEKVSSGDKLVDWFFNRIIHALKYKVRGIYKKKILKEKYVYLYGFLDEKERKIYLSAIRHKSRDEIAKTLLHEVCHLIFDKICERNILQLENVYGIN